ncbi:MAG: response regulator [Firmicutes bacterium]|nr:response regulator [Bacillota bacterium]
MTVRERLLDIPELNIAEILIQMRDIQLDEYIESLNSFVENLSARERELKDSFSAKDYYTFSKYLVAFKDTLIDIHADELAEECQKQINNLSSAKHEKVEAFLTYFLSLMAMLSIDIQMAAYHDENNTECSIQELSGFEPEDGQKSILAVDDHAFFLDTLKQSLQDTGHKLICVRSGAEALKYLQKHNPNLFILDIEMPEMNGYELARNIREQGKQAPIIFLTGNATPEYVNKALQAGAADFIVKPATKKYVIERVNRFI